MKTTNEIKRHPVYLSQEQYSILINLVLGTMAVLEQDTTRSSILMIKELSSLMILAAKLEAAKTPMI